MTVKQVIVMRKDLNMRKGKMVAQGAHASIKWLVDYMSSSGRDMFYELTKDENDWLNGSFTKICVYVNSEEELLAIDQAAMDAGVKSSLIQDSGLTEFGGVPTYTCLALGPDTSENIDPISGHLPLL